MTQLYGIDDKLPVTALMVRDALIECFYEAHCGDVGLDTQDVDLNREYCRSVVEKAFEETGGRFDQPTKESLVAAMQWLVTFSKNFRDPSIIQRHMGEIQSFVNKLA